MSIYIAVQVYNEVRNRKAHTAVVYVFIGFLNVMGMVGGLMFYGAIAEDELTPHQPPAALGDTEQHIQVEITLYFILNSNSTHLAHYNFKSSEVLINEFHTLLK